MSRFAALLDKENPPWRGTAAFGIAAKLFDFMSVRIRMKRMGARNTPAYRIVVADGRSPRDGKFIEEIGSYLPLKKGDNFIINMERAEYWIKNGAQPSDTVASFIRKVRRTAAPVVA